MWFRYKRGDLFNKVQQYNWDTDLSFIADERDFRDVQVVTLQQYLYDLAAERAASDKVDLHQFESYIDYLLQTQYHSAYEFVAVYTNKIVVGVNANKVDDRTIDYAKTLLIQLDSFEPGTKQRFGRRITIYDSDKNEQT